VYKTVVRAPVTWEVSGVCQAWRQRAVSYNRLYSPCSRCIRSPVLGSARAQTLSYSAVKLFSKYSNLCEKHTSTSQTDRRRDRQTEIQTTYNPITALFVTSRGKKTKFNSHHGWRTGACASACAGWDMVYPHPRCRLIKSQTRNAFGLTNNYSTFVNFQEY